MNNRGSSEKKIFGTDWVYLGLWVYTINTLLYTYYKALLMILKHLSIFCVYNVQFVLFLTKYMFLYKKTRAKWQVNSLTQLDFRFFSKGHSNLKPAIGPVVGSDRVFPTFL